MGCKECGKPKCNGKCGCKSPKVLQINNPAEYITFHKVSIPAAMGDSTTNPPKIGAYRNALVYYEADRTSWMYSTDGIPTLVTGEQGPTGPQGPAGTITIGTTTAGETGSDAEVENVGTPENAILNFTIPKGDKGDQGIQGETGPQGYMNEQDVRDVVDTIVPEGFFDDEATVSECGTSFELDGIIDGRPKSLQVNGDTYQQNYDGKNLVYLVPNNGSSDVNGLSATYDEQTGAIHISGTPTQTWANIGVRTTIALPAGTYTISAVDSQQTHSKALYAYHSDNTRTQFYVGPTETAKTVTVTKDIVSYYIYISQMVAGEAIDDTFYLMLEAGSTASSFEPYVGGVPSPNPDYPQQIQTVTGEQTVTINGTDYPLDLGSIELCGLGDDGNGNPLYKDYIYPDGDDWKVHKATGSATFDGSQDEAWIRSGQSTSTVFVAALSNMLSSGFVHTKDNGGNSLNTHFKFGATTEVGRWKFNDNSDADGEYKYLLLRFDASAIPDIASAIDWLANNPVTVKYPASTTTDTVITDGTLIAQLEAIRLDSGANTISVSFSEVNGELCIEAYSENWNGTISSLDERLDTIEQDYLRSGHKIIFMPVDNSIAYDTAAGDCSVIKTSSGKVVMIDTGATHSYPLIKAELEKNNITKIDFIIITHFHSDHTGNISSLASDFDLTNTEYYIQKHSDAAVGVAPGSEDAVLAVAGDNPVYRPDSGDKISIDGITITFFNCNQEDVDYYDTQNTSVNNYSICCYVDCGANTFLFTGDIMNLAAQRVYDQGWLHPVDVEKVEHHSVIYGSDGMSDFNLAIKPTYGVVSASSGMYPLLAFNSSETDAVKIALGTKIYATMGEAVVLYFNDKFYSINGGERIYSHINRSSSRIDLYVDSSYAGASDGTSARPFKNLLAALGMAQSIRGIGVRINIQSSYTSEEEIRLFCCPTHITVVGNITIKNLTIVDSDIYFNGVVTVTDTIDSCAAIEESNARFDELVIAGDTTEATNDGRGLRTVMSSIRITTLNISNRKTAFGIYRASRVQIDEIKGTANTYGYVVTEGSTLAVGKWNADFATTREYKARYYAIASKSPFLHLSPNAIEKLTNGADLNDFNVPGVYMSEAGAITLSLLNKPSGIGYAFNLKVEYLNGTNNLLQTIVSGNLDHTNTGIYVRVFDQSQQVWSKWQTVINGEA